MFSLRSSEGIHILNYQKNWICISTIECKPGEVNVYDSLFSNLPQSAVHQICNLLHTKQSKLTIHTMDMKSDCGLFAIACAVALCFGQDPCTMNWTQKLPVASFARIFLHFLRNLVKPLQLPSAQLTSLSFAPVACLGTDWAWLSVPTPNSGFTRNARISQKQFLVKIYHGHAVPVPLICNFLLPGV